MNSVHSTASVAHHACTASCRKLCTRIAHLDLTCAVLQKSVPFLSLLEGGDEEVDQDPDYTNWWLDHGARYEQINGTVCSLNFHCMSYTCMSVAKPPGDGRTVQWLASLR